jgi:hypothetical protein
MRLALIYALLDQSPVIHRVHLDAALAVWKYCDSSAACILGDTLGDKVADDILRILRALPAGLTRNEIRDALNRHQPSNRIGAALDVLQGRGLAYSEREETGGRPAERWFATDCAVSAEGAERSEK